MALSALHYTVNDLRYDAATHTTTLPDGRDVPHVTAILHATGVAEDFEALSAHGQRLQAAIGFARDRGTAVHADCHAYDDDDLDWATVDPRVGPYVEAWAQARESLGLTPVRRERQVYHPTFVYTGILDGIFQRADRRRILVDLKTGDPESGGAAYQTAAYEAAYLCQHPDETVDERWAVWLQPALRVPYRVINYTAQPASYTHFGSFQAFLVTYHAQACRRARMR